MNAPPILLVLCLVVVGRLGAASADPVLAPASVDATMVEQQVLAPFATATIADADHTHLKQLRVLVDQPVAGDQLTHGTLPAQVVLEPLAAPAQGGRTSLIFTGTATVAIYQTLLRSIRFTTGDAPGPQRTISADVRDSGDAASNISVATVAITAEDDAPSFSRATTTATVVEQQGVTLWGGIAIADPDSAQLGRLEVTIAQPLPEDRLGFTPQPGLAVGFSGGVLLAESNQPGVHASRAAYQSLLRSITFTPGNDAPGTARTITAVAQDETGVASPPMTATVTITQVNDAPGITPALAILKGDERQIIPLFPNAVIADDGPQIDRLEARIDGEPNPSDLLEYSPVAGIDVKREEDGDLVASGVADVTRYQALLHSIAYRSVGHMPAIARTIRVTVREAGPVGSSGLTSAEARADVTVTPLNDPPTISATALESATDEDGPELFTFAALATGANDPDGDGLGIRIDSIAWGSLEVLVGETASPVVPGSTVLQSGQRLRWTPPLDAVDEAGAVAFTVSAWDGALASPTSRSVRMAVRHVVDLGGFDDPVAYNLDSGRLRLASESDRLTIHPGDKPLLAGKGSRLVARLLSGKPDQDLLQVTNSLSASLTLGSGSRILRDQKIDIAGWSGNGVGQSPLIITFTAAATVDDIENVSRCITYDNLFGETGEPGPRVVELHFEEDKRPLSNPVSKTIAVRLPNSPPAIVLGTDAASPIAFSVPPGGNAVIRASHARAIDLGASPTPPVDLIFTVVSEPAYGNLRLIVGGTAITLGTQSEFTQADVDAGLVSYHHRGGTIPTDAIGLRVRERALDGLSSDTRTLLVQVGIQRGLGIISDPIMTAVQGQHLDHVIRLVGSSGSVSPKVTVLDVGTNPTQTIGSTMAVGDGTQFRWMHIFSDAGLQSIQVVVELETSFIVQPMQVMVLAPITGGG